MRYCLGRPCSGNLLANNPVLGNLIRKTELDEINTADTRTTPFNIGLFNRLVIFLDFEMERKL
jgi:hypothetical protein